MGEFELIERYFERPAALARDGRRVLLGIGDDCALLTTRAGFDLAVSSDMLLAGRHFRGDVAPESLGHKSLAVNLSDLAAMGAEPLGFTLSLALPQFDAAWLDGFSRGLHDCAATHGCALVGGDTTRGPLTIAITVFGEVGSGTALRRDAACPGDDVWVSGVLGDAALALRILQGELAATPDGLAAVRPALERPVPRLALGQALKTVAHAAIDLSDGLAGDLRHILKRSRVGARIEPERLPAGPLLAQQDRALRLACQMTGGDDYELCFTAPIGQRPVIEELAERLALRLTRIGSIQEGSELDLVDAAGHPFLLPDGVPQKGFDHFG